MQKSGRVKSQNMEALQCTQQLPAELAYLQSFCSRYNVWNAADVPPLPAERVLHTLLLTFG
jgi:hypothetical protein